MKRLWAKQKGFTIVELLIVIVVIGILAAIIVVAFNGVQNRAKNTQTVSGMTNYVKALTAYTSDKGVYPIPNGYLACFGGINDCNGAADAAQTAALASQLSPYTNSASLTLLGGSGALVNYISNYVMPDSSSFTGQYIYFRQVGTNTCPVMAGTRFMYSTASGSDIICRYALPVL